MRNTMMPSLILRATLACCFAALISTNVYASSNTLTDRLDTVLSFAALGRYDRHRRPKSICESEDWRKQSLKLIKEVPFAGLFPDTHGESKFEASGLVQVNGTYYVVFDSHRSLGSVGDKLEVLSNHNHLIGQKGEESQFEGIAYRYDTNTFLVVQESHEHGEEVHPAVEELQLTESGDEYEVVSRCHLQLELSHANKGVEGIQYYNGGDKGIFLLAICEGNFCKGGQKGRQAGNGRIIVSQLHVNDSDASDCSWVPMKTVKIPETAYFQDYSGMAFNKNRFGIISQENAALWVGEFDFETMDFVGDGQVYHFPRDNNCDIVYCTVEGLSWLDNQRITVTLDRAKSDQPFVCTLKDQSIAMFALPYGA